MTAFFVNGSVCRAVRTADGWWQAIIGVNPSTGTVDRGPQFREYKGTRMHQRRIDAEAEAFELTEFFAQVQRWAAEDPGIVGLSS